MKIIRILTISWMLYGYIMPAYAEGLPANPWGKVPQENIQEPDMPDSPSLKANPWKNPQSTHVVRFSDSVDDSADTPSQTYEMNIPKQISAGTMSHTKSPIKIISRSDLNKEYSDQSQNNSDFSSMLDNILPSEKSHDFSPKFSMGNGGQADSNIIPDIDMPDFDKIKRDSTRKFNNFTAPIRKMGQDAKEYFEKGSGINLNQVLK